MDFMKHDHNNVEITFALITLSKILMAFLIQRMSDHETLKKKMVPI